LSCFDPVSNLQLGKLIGFGAAMDCESRPTRRISQRELHSDSVGFSNYVRMRKVLFDAVSSKIRPQIKRRNTNFHMSISAGRRTVTYIWKLGPDLLINAFTPQTGLDKNCSVSNISRTTEKCLDLSPTEFTPPTRTRQDSLVLAGRRCELGMRIATV